MLEIHIAHLCTPPHHITIIIITTIITTRAQQLEAKLSTAETHIDTLTQQVAALQHENKTLLEQSATDQASRKRADDTRTWADAERFRLQRSRDELALKVKVVSGGEWEGVDHVGVMNAVVVPLCEHTQ